MAWYAVDLFLNCTKLGEKRIFKKVHSSYIKAVVHYPQPKGRKVRLSRWMQVETTQNEAQNIHKSSVVVSHAIFPMYTK